MTAFLDDLEALLTGTHAAASPLDLACRLDPRIKRTPALEAINTALVDAFHAQDARLAISMPPQEGKTTLAVLWHIVWALQQDPNLPVVLGTYNQALANRNGRLIRNAIDMHPELGYRIADDNGAKGEWSIAGHDGGLVSAGRGVGISGRPAGLVVIDDPFKEGEAQSEVIREQAWEWWTEGISARMAPGTTVVVIHTRWHEDDLIGRLLERDAHAGWTYLNIPAQCEDADADPLGRAAGEFMVSARGRSRKQWEQRRLTVGSRVWNALYQGRPSPAEGGIVKRDWWRTYDIAPWIEREDGSRWAAGMDQMLISADLTFKGGDGSDYVAIGVWGCRGPNAFLLDQVRGHFDFPETLRRFTALCAKWPQATLKLVEDKANGPAMIASLSSTIGGIVPEIPQGSKEARATAVSPLIEAGNVHLPSPRLAPWIDDYIEEWAAFPNGAHDDQVDQTTQALNRLLLQPILHEDRDEVFDLYDHQSIINY